LNGTFHTEGKGKLEIHSLNIVTVKHLIWWSM
jgi:hypothetical protein